MGVLVPRDAVAGEVREYLRCGFDRGIDPFGVPADGLGRLDVHPEVVEEKHALARLTGGLLERAVDCLARLAEPEEVRGVARAETRYTGILDRAEHALPVRVVGVREAGGGDAGGVDVVDHASDSLVFAEDPLVMDSRELILGGEAPERVSRFDPP